MTTLIFDEHITGHHLEYIHHYYRGALVRPYEKFIFCLEDGFLKVKDDYDWPKADNISFEIMSAEELADIKQLHGWRRGLRTAKLIKKKSSSILQHQEPVRIILTNFIHMIPYLLIVMPSGAKVMGIIYRIYLYNKGKDSWLRYHIERICYQMMAWSNVMEKIFILNDKQSADELNRCFNTNKFKFLPDPVPEVDISKCKVLREELNIPPKNKVFFHFGGMKDRKGTLEIMKAINMSSDEELENKTFVFAGRIYDEIHEEFYALYEQLKTRSTKSGIGQFLVFDEFCTYEFLYNMCYTCDVILMPYQLTELSSGILGYAAVFGKPVIGPAGGLIGKLINKYQLGLALKNVYAEGIKKSFSIDIDCQPSKYAEQNKVSEFIKVILD